MKKQKEPNYTKQAKVLSKNYQFLEPQYVKLLFQFCQFQAVKTCRVLQVLKDMQMPTKFIMKLVQFPNQSDDIIKKMQSQYLKKNGNIQPEIMSLLVQKQQNPANKSIMIDQNTLDFFSLVPQDVCASILSYLDPISFSRISQTNKKFLSLTKSEPLNFYFKNLCMKLFCNEQPQLPSICRFDEIRNYVQSHHIQYGPNIRNAVINNLRYYIWKSQPKSFKIQNITYYKSFGSYRNLYIQAPRVHFNGIYVCKHKYVRLGQKGFIHTITPMHVIYYYRYFRFFQDGSLLCYVSPTKCRKQQLSKYLSIHNLDNYDPNNKNQIKIGQFMQYKNTLYIKLVRCNTVFSYQLQINSQDNKISNQLMVINYTLQMVDQREIIQNLYTYKPHKQKILFHYLRNQDIEIQNSSRIQAVSL